MKVSLKRCEWAVSPQTTLFSKERKLNLQSTCEVFENGLTCQNYFLNGNLVP